MPRPALLIWDGLQLQVPITMEPVILEPGFIRLIGPEPPTIDLRFESSMKLFDTLKEGRSILDRLGMVGETIEPCEESWTRQLEGKLFRASKIFFFQFELSKAIVILHFSTTPPPILIEEIFRSLHWSPIESWRRWLVFDITFTTPPGYLLDCASFKPGHFHLVFTRGQSQLLFDRLAPANVILDNSSLTKWLRGFIRESKFGEIHLRSENEFEINFIESRGLIYNLLPWVNRVNEEGHGNLRHLTKDNKILMLTSKGSKLPDDAFRRVQAQYVPVSSF